MAKAENQVSKKALIDKANSTMVAVMAVAGFMIMFSLVASRALWAQRGYQSRVITEKEKAVKDLEGNIEAVKKLQVSYAAFTGASDNIIKGNPSGTGDRDGDNPKIVLDALPSKYDFPAFITSVEKLLKNDGYALASIGGKDEEVDQASPKSKTPIEIPFEVSTIAENNVRVQNFFQVLERSIRPINIKSVTLSGGDKGGGVKVSVEGVSYYQPAKGVTIELKEMK